MSQVAGEKTVLVIAEVYDSPERGTVDSKWQKLEDVSLESVILKDYLGFTLLKLSRDEIYLFQKKTVTNNDSKVDTFILGIFLSQEISEKKLYIQPVFNHRYMVKIGGSAQGYKYENISIYGNDIFTRAAKEIKISSNIEGSHLLIIPWYFYEDKGDYYLSSLRKLIENRISARSIENSLHSITDQTISFTQKKFVILCGSKGHGIKTEILDIPSAVIPKSIIFKF